MSCARSLGEGVQSACAKELLELLCEIAGIESLRDLGVVLVGHGVRLTRGSKVR